MNVETTKRLYFVKLIEVLASLGCNTEPVLRAAGLNQANLQDRDYPLPISEYLLGLEAAVQKFDIPDLGFLVGEHTNPLEHGVLGYALLSSPTLRESLQRYVRFQYLQGPLLNISFTEFGPMAALSATPLRGNWRLSERAMRYLVQEWLIGWNQWCHLIGRSGNFFEHVRLAYSADRQRRYYESHLGCTVSFDNRETSALFSSKRLELPLEYADQSIAALCSVQCEALLDMLKLRRGLVAEIYRQLVSLPGQVPTMDGIANRLHVGTRTLRRRLRQENVTYQELVCRYRVAMATRFLSETSLPVNEIAALVGYSEPANLYRIFQKYTGLTPLKYRERHETSKREPTDLFDLRKCPVH